MIDVTLDLSPVVHHKAGLATYAQHLGEALIQSHSIDLSLRAFSYGGGGTAAHPLNQPLASLAHTRVRWGARRWRLTVAVRTFAKLWMDATVGIHHGNANDPPSTGRVFHATEHLLPPLRTARSVFTFHDGIYALFPQFHLRLNLWFLNLMMPRFLRQANRIIAVSECSRRDCIRLYNVPQSKITVIHEAADPKWRPIDTSDALDLVRRKYGVPSRFMLFLATIEPRKNIGTILEAMQVMVAQSIDLASDDLPVLVVAGRKGWLYEPLFAKVAELALTQRVIFTGYVPDQDAVALMNAATLFVFPSLYEGFGLPALEAMACGTPVVCSDTSSLPEVVGDAAVTVSPTDVAALAAALQSVWSRPDVRAGLRARGLARAATFSWERAAAQTANVYREVVA